MFTGDGESIRHSKYFEIGLVGVTLGQTWQLGVPKRKVS